MTDAFAHHVWATLRLLDTSAELSPEQLEATVPGTYGSIVATLRHIVGADRAYLNLLTGGDLAPIDEDQLDLDGLRAVMEEDAAAWTALLAAEPLDPDAMVVRYRDDGSESHAPLGVRLAQAIHHGTDHRSQICTILTALGVEPPEIDVWAFAWEDGRLAETPPSS